jgi:hemerythrin-like domain-containing protein
MNKPIKRHASLINLSRDHYSGLLLASVLKKNTPHYKNMPESPEDKSAFVQLKYKTELREHFIAEEEILFPFVKGRMNEIDTLIDELLGEHRFLESKISGIGGSEDLVSDLDEIGHVLERHIRKEERQLFQLIQDMLSENELLILEERLKASH